MWVYGLLRTPKQLEGLSKVLKWITCIAALNGLPLRFIHLMLKVRHVWPALMTEITMLV